MRKLSYFLHLVRARTVTISGAFRQECRRRVALAPITQSRSFFMQIKISENHRKRVKLQTSIRDDHDQIMTDFVNPNKD